MQDTIQTTNDWLMFPTLVTPTSYSEKQTNHDVTPQANNEDETISESTMDVDSFITTNETLVCKNDVIFENE